MNDLSPVPRCRVVMAHTAARRQQLLEARLNSGDVIAGCRTEGNPAPDEVEALAELAPGTERWAPDWLRADVGLGAAALATLRIREALRGRVRLEGELMSAEECRSRLLQMARSTKAARDDKAEELTAAREERKVSEAREIEASLNADRRKLAELEESVAHAKECNRRRSELISRIQALRSNVPGTLPPGDFCEVLNRFKESHKSLLSAKDAVLVQESMTVLGRGPDWTAPLEHPDMARGAGALRFVIESLDDLGQQAAKVDEAFRELSGPPLDEAHLEELASQLASQPQEGLEALDAKGGDEPAVPDAAADEANLRRQLRGLDARLSAALAAGLLSLAAGVVLALGEAAAAGFAGGAVGVFASGAWVAVLLSRRRGLKGEIAEAVRRRVRESSHRAEDPREKSAVSEQDKLPAVAERARNIYAARKATARNRLEIRAVHATWTKSVLSLPDWLRRRLPKIPDPFSPESMDGWRRDARELLATLEAEVVRLERVEALAHARQAHGRAMEQFASCRNMLVQHLGSDSAGLTNEELESRARVLLGDCSQIVALESALAQLSEISVAPMEERITALMSAINANERRLRAWGDSAFDPPAGNFEGHPDLEAIHAELVRAERAAHAAKVNSEKFDADCASCQIALDILQSVISERAAAIARSIRARFDDFAQWFWHNLGGLAPNTSTPGLDHHLGLAVDTPEHLRPALEILRSMAIKLAVRKAAAAGVETPPVHFVLNEPLADADPPTFLAWFETMLDVARGEDCFLNLLTCQQWRVDSIRGVRAELAALVGFERDDG